MSHTLIAVPADHQGTVSDRMQTFPFILVVLFTKIISANLMRRDFGGELSILTDRIIDEYFKKFPCVTYVLDEGVEMDPSQALSLIVRLPGEQDIIRESFEQGCGGYILQVHNKSEVTRLLIGARHRATGYRYNNQRYLFLPMNEKDVDLEFMNDPQLFFLPNLVLMIPKGDGFLAVTHTVFDHHKHDILKIAFDVLDAWTPEEGFCFGNDLYPDKVADVKGKKFIFAVVNYSPFSLVKEEGNRTIFDGFETRIVAEFVETVNGTWEGLNHPVELWGGVFPNGTGTGIVGSVVENKADFGFAAFYQWFCEECDCTYPFYQSEVTCLVPRPELVSGWLTIILPFKTATWMALISVYFMSSIFIFGLLLMLESIKGSEVKDKIGMAISDSFFTNFRLQLEQIPMISKSKGPLSVYVKISVYYYFVAAAFWQGGIASILTVPRFEDPINEVTDLLKRWPKMEWGANTNAWLNSIRASSDPNLIQIVSKFKIYDDETLSRKTKTRDFGFFVEKLPHGHYGYNDYITEESMNYLRLMEKNVYTAFGVAILPRGSPYSEKFDRTILWLFDTGVVHKIEVQVSLERINNRLQNMIKFSNLKEANTVILAVRHIQGPIIILIGGMSLACLTFLLEILIFHRHHVFSNQSKFRIKNKLVLNKIK